MNSRPLTLGDGELMAQHQDLRVLPPRLRKASAQVTQVFGTHSNNRAHRRRTMSPCQRMMVPGVTISRIAASRSMGSAPVTSDRAVRTHLSA
jgi:hypothetical protein